MAVIEEKPHVNYINSNMWSNLCLPVSSGDTFGSYLVIKSEVTKAPACDLVLPVDPKTEPLWLGYSLLP